MVARKRKKVSTSAKSDSRTATASAALAKKRAKSGSKLVKGKKAKATKKTTVKVAVVEVPASPSKSATDVSSETSSTTTTQTNRKRKGQTPIRLVPHADMPIARFNLASDLWCEYNFSQVFDQGVQREKWTSYRLKTDVLLLETARERYELVRVCNALARPSTTLLGTSVQDTFELFRVLEARKMDDKIIASLPRPLPNNLKSLVVGGLNWNEISWGKSSVQVRDIVLHMTCICFVPRTAQGNVQQVKQIIDLQCPPPSLTLASNANATKNNVDSIHAGVSADPALSKQGGVKRSLPVSESQPSSTAAVLSVDAEGQSKRHKPSPLVSSAARVAVSRELQLRRGMTLFGEPASGVAN